MRNSPASERRRSKRIVTKKRASLLVNLNGRVERFPSVVVDKSQDGFRLRGSFRLRRGQAVEVTFDDGLLTVRCQVRWVREGEAGLETV
jgi:PilZ domain-containing protein